MIRFRLKYFNWKYIVGEILLIFIGISLAIWFNNWNSSNKMDAKKQIAIEKIQDEISNNLDELILARNVNTNIPEALKAFGMLGENFARGTVATITQMKTFHHLYPGFFRVKDSTKLKEDLFRYVGDTHINLELPLLNEIAWETTKDMGIANEFGYDCLYNLESMYNLQRLVENEINKAAEALQNKEIEHLLRVLGTVHQLDAQLENLYISVLDNMDDCM